MSQPTAQLDLIEAQIIVTLTRLGGMTSGQLQQQLGIGRRVVWQHLVSLRTKGLIWHHTQRRHRYYDVVRREAQ